MSHHQLKHHQVRLARRWMTVVLFGLFIFVIGVEPDLIGMDRSPVVGFVQVGVWLTGLGILLLGAYATVRVIRNNRPNSLRADIGLRLIATGYVVAATASLADFVGLGAHRIPDVSFGPIQIFGLVVGVLLCLLGLVLYRPSRERPDEERRRWRLPRIKLPRMKGRVRNSAKRDEGTARPDSDNV